MIKGLKCDNSRYFQAAKRAACRKSLVLGLRNCAALFFALLSCQLVLAEPPRRALELELEDVPGVVGYELQVERVLPDRNKKAPLFFKIKSNKWSAKLVPGKYDMKVRSIDSRGVPGEWSPPQELIVKLPAVELTSPANTTVIKSDESDQEKVAFEWKPVEGAENYKLKVLDPEGKVVSETVETSASAKLRLPVAAAYSWTVIPVGEQGTEGDAPEHANQFEIFGSVLSKPKIVSVDDINTFVFRWNQVEKAENYFYSLEKKNEDGSWGPVEEKETSESKRVLVRPLPTGVYRVRVYAAASRREKSPLAEREFKTQHLNTRSPAAIEQVRSEKAYETKSRYFAQASYYLAMVFYQGVSYDYNTVTNYYAVGGTGRVGAGAWFGEDSQWGIQSINDLSGFTIRDKTYTYFATALEGVYRRRLGALGQLRVFSGLGYRELPITVGLSASSSATFQTKIGTLGPILGAAVTHVFWRKFGFQVNGQVYDAAAAISNPGTGHKSSISYQAGLLGSLQLSDNLVGFAGYAYRYETASYFAPVNASGSSSGDSLDTVTISGGYINLMLEYGF